ALHAAPAVYDHRHSYLVSTYFKWTLHAAETSTRKGAGKIALTNELHPTSRGFEAMATKFDVAWRHPASFEEDTVLS
ncbi:hypothetical protein, partial [Rhizobium ruizarguesonis]|uniref:hypothetical protein n=1 Tax=Rhizobium ruizarguesonis TaxID=2081791 RepID=UPI001A8F2607